jgi:cobalamin biosynthesis Mg chelatase CobN
VSLNSIQGTLVNVRAQADDAQSLVDAGDREPSDKSAIDDYRRAASRADTVATLCQNVTGIVVQEVPSTAGYDAAVASEVDAASASDSEAGHATTRAAARAAAVAGVAAARSAISYATAAASKVPATPRVTVGWFAAAVVVVAAGAFVFAKYRPKRTVPRIAYP